MQAINLLIGNFSGKKPKERFETILEPLQAILQIACLAYFPVGSKLSIHNNILFIQNAGYAQNVKRWYYNDKKEDLFYLYNVFSRFSKFYKNILDPHASSVTGATAATAFKTNNKDQSNSSVIVNSQLFSLLHDLAKTGINNLIRTYNQTEKTHILHTLQMYKGMLDSPELVRKLTNCGGSGSGNDSMNKIVRSQTLSDDADHYANNDKELSHKKNNANSGHLIPIDNLLEQSTSNVDSIFINITELYTQDDFDIIYHTLMKIQNDPQYYMNYVDGLNKILEPINIRIKKWIDDNIVF
jgi:hypothetical protein